MTDQDSIVPVSIRVDEVLPTNATSPSYRATMLWEPGGSVVLSEATTPDGGVGMKFPMPTWGVLSIAVPRTVVPLRNETRPLIGPREVAFDGVTVAVSVTAVGSCEAVRVVVV